MFKFLFKRDRKTIDHDAEIAEFNKNYNARPALLSTDGTVYADISKLQAEIITSSMITTDKIKDNVITNAHLANTMFSANDMRRIMEVSSNCTK